MFRTLALLPSAVWSFSLLDLPTDTLLERLTGSAVVFLWLLPFCEVTLVVDALNSFFLYKVGEDPTDCSLESESKFFTRFVNESLFGLATGDSIRFFEAGDEEDVLDDTGIDELRVLPSNERPRQLCASESWRVKLVSFLVREGGPDGFNTPLDMYRLLVLLFKLREDGPAEFRPLGGFVAAM